ncbi:MAG: large repetitive protein [Acidobacteriota bacterium]|jgi:hypothetical protein|nr:large repetitive protein [Acidobacteriota bacterium]
MNLIKFLACVSLCLLTSSVSQAQYFQFPGNFSYSLNSINQVMDVSGDGKIAVVLQNEPVAVHPALLTTFDPILGTQLDSRTFGFGPLGVQLAEVNGNLRAVVLTSEGGPRKIYLFDISPAGILTQVASTQLSTSGSDVGTNLVLSSQSQTGYTLVAPATGAGMELVSFSLLDGAVLNRLPVAGGNYTLAMAETAGKRILVFPLNSSTLAVVDALNPSQPIKLGDIALPRNTEFSGISYLGVAFSADARYVFVGNQFVDFSVVDLSSMSVVASIGGNFRFGRVRIHENSQRRLLAIQTTESGTGAGGSAILLVDATDPVHPSIIKQQNISPFIYKSDFAFSRDGSKLFLANNQKLSAFNLPNFDTAWEQPISASVTREHQVIALKNSDDVLGSWQISNGSGFVSLIGSFPVVPPNISINDITVTEGDSGTTAANFTVTLSAPTTHRVTINYATANGTGIKGIDYSETTGAISFQPGETTKTISVPIIGDVSDEFDETFKLNISNATVGIVVRAQGTGTIEDNDPPPAVSVGDGSVLEGDFDGTNMDFQLSLSAPSGKPVSVQFKATDDTAIGGGTDYFYPAITSVDFLPGETSKTVSISVIGDVAIEPDERFFIDVLAVSNATVGRGRGVGTILNDDAAPTVSLSVNDITVTEGNSGTTPAVFTISLSGTTSKTVKVNYFALSDTAGAGVDFQGTSGTLTFTPGQTTKTVTVSVFGDTILEGNERFSLELRDAANANVADAQGWATIIDDDSIPSLSINDISIIEGNSGRKTAVFTVTLSSKSAQQVAVSYRAAAGTATADQDYQTVFGRMLFGPEGTSQTIFVDIFGDAVNEGNETFFMDLSDPSGATIARARGVCTIIDDDNSVLQLNQSSYTVGEAGGNVALLVTRTDATSTATVNYATSDTFPISQGCQTLNTGIASSRCDYATTIGTLRFEVGESSKTIFIPIVDDNLADGDEAFSITLSIPNGVSLGANSSATITITDNANTPGNPIDSVPFFVREHYIDFLGREPEPGGFQAWQDILNNCGSTVAPPCDKIEVSSAFFRSEEFQSRGYFIYRFYSAVGKIPSYNQFMPDFAKVSGFLSSQQLEANKLAFVDEFMLRSDFQSLYGTLGSPASYVTALLQTVGLPNHPKKQTWINGLTSQVMTRGQVLRELTESAEVYQKYYTEAFVIMQYFGYLRRDADISYLSWIETMNQSNGDYRTMINGFLNSLEYRQRFGN